MYRMSSRPEDILTVSEDRAERREITRALRRAGYRVAEAASLQGALRHLRHRPPELVLLDSAFARHNGLRICQEARERAGAAVLPLMHVSDMSADGAALAAALACGSETPLVVPLNARVLLSTVEAVLRLHHAERALRQAREEAEEAQRRLQTTQGLQLTVLEQLPAGVVIADARTERVILLNQVARQALGLPSQEFSLDEFYQHFVGLHPDGRPYEIEEWPLVRALHHGEVILGEEIELLVGPDTHLQARLNAAPLRDASGEIVAAVITFVDLTEAKRAQRIVETVFEAAPNWLAYLDTDLRFVHANRACAEAVGVTQEALRGRAFADVFAETEAVIAVLRGVVETGEPSSLREVPPLRPAALPRHPADYVDAASVPIKNAQGKVEGLVISVVDVSEKVRHRQVVEAAARARAQEAQLLEVIQSSTTNVLIYLDRELRFAYVNTALERALGRPASELLGRMAEQLFPEHGELLGIAARARDTGEAISLTEFAVPMPGKPEDSPHYVDATLTPVRGASGEVEGVVVSVNDVTEKVRQRDRLLEVERARTQLAENLNNEIAHRVKNNLAMVSGLLQMQMYMQPDPRLTELLRDAITRVRTFAHIHEQMYSTRQEHLDVRDAMERVAHAAEEIYGAATPLAVSVEGDHATYRSRAVTNLSIVANELLTNAIKHGRPEADGKVHIELTVAAEDGAFRLRLWNSGDTLPADFNIAQQHSSMGLRLVWDIVVEQYGGTLSLRPARGGTEAEVVLTEATLAHA